MSNWQPNKNWVTVEAQILTETERAIRIQVEDKKSWLPKSQIRNIEAVMDEYYDSPESRITVELMEWIAIKNQIDNYCAPLDPTLEQEE